MQTPFNWSSGSTGEKRVERIVGAPLMFLFNNRLRGELQGSRDRDVSPISQRYTPPRPLETIQDSRNLPEIGGLGGVKIFVQIWPEASDYIL